MRIDEAIHYLERIKQEYDCSYEEDALNMAIASLEAWEKVRQEIDEQHDRVHPYNISCAEGLEMALAIIDKHLQERSDKE